MSGHDDALRERLAGVLATEGWCCDPYGHEDGPPAPGECGDCDRLRGDTANALLPVLADVRAEAAREALREAADKMPVRVIGAVGSSLPHRWLRARADRIGGEQR